MMNQVVPVDGDWCVKHGWKSCLFDCKVVLIYGRQHYIAALSNASGSRTMVEVQIYQALAHLGSKTHGLPVAPSPLLRMSSHIQPPSSCGIPEASSQSTNITPWSTSRVSLHMIFHHQQTETGTVLMWSPLWYLYLSALVWRCTETSPFPASPCAFLLPSVAFSLCPCI